MFEYLSCTLTLWKPSVSYRSVPAAFSTRCATIVLLLQAPVAGGQRLRPGPRIPAAEAARGPPQN